MPIFYYGMIFDHTSKMMDGRWSGHFVYGSMSDLNLLSNLSGIPSSKSWYLWKLDTFSNSQKQ